MSDQHLPTPRLLCIGAHPDDCEIQASGLAALWTGRGGSARFISMTDGSAGHQELGGAQLANIRRGEARAGAAAVGADSVVFDNLDSSLLPTLENRHRVIQAVREYQPDVIATHRTNDYHPDHRYTGVTVQDACYMVMVPNALPRCPVPDREPVVVPRRVRRVGARDGHGVGPQELAIELGVGPPGHEDLVSPEGD